MLTPEITIGFTTSLTLPTVILAWLKTNIFTPICFFSTLVRAAFRACVSTII